jgi:hypothetical protein
VSEATTRAAAVDRLDRVDGVGHPVRRADAHALRARLGRHRPGAACLSVNRPADVDPGILRRLVDTGYRHVMSDLPAPVGSPSHDH